MEQSEASRQSGWVYLIMPGITCALVLPFVVVQLRSPEPLGGMALGFSPLVLGVLSFPGYWIGCRAISRGNIEKGRWTWAVLSGIVGGLASGAGAVFGAFTVIFGVLGILSLITCSLYLRRLSLLRPRQAPSNG